MTAFFENTDWPTFIVSVLTGLGVLYTAWVSNRRYRDEQNSRGDNPIVSMTAQYVPNGAFDIEISVVHRGLSPWEAVSFEVVKPRTDALRVVSASVDLSGVKVSTVATSSRCKAFLITKTPVKGSYSNGAAFSGSEEFRAFVVRNASTAQREITMLASAEYWRSNDLVFKYTLRAKNTSARIFEITSATPVTFKD